MSGLAVPGPTPSSAPGLADARRTLAVASLAHALHDGFSSSIYVLLPVWQAQFGLGYAALGLLRALYVGALAALQVPSSHLARRLGARTVLGLGTLLAGAGYGLAGLSGGIVGLCLSLAVAGAGGSTQHPLASAAVSRAYGRAARGPLGTYNFAGDVGKASLPPAVSLMLATMDWRTTVWIVAVLGLAAASLIYGLMAASERTPALARPLGSATLKPEGAAVAGRGRGGFGLLLAIAMLDSAAGVTFLLFLPALLRSKGAALPTLGLALALIFIGGACGKAACGWLGARMGLLATVAGTEVGTAAAILAILVLPLAPGLVLLPVLGIMMNGTSSVLYGTVPELVGRDRIEHAFAVFYSCTLGSSALAPVLLGWLGDGAGLVWGVAASAATALCVVPPMILLAPRLARQDPVAGPA